MPPKTKKALKVKIPELQWAEDDYKKTWEFINLLEKEENYKVLFGKKAPGENTSGDTRIAVFRRIAQALFPFYFELDGGTVADRLKSLRQDGEDAGEDSQYADDSQREVFEYYIPPEGPSETTPAEAVNLWQKIERDFPFFPRLHRIFSTRPNVTPIAITTALGPGGRKTVWYQSPDDDAVPESSNAPPPLTVTPNAATLSPPRVFGANLTNSAPVPTPTHHNTTNATVTPSKTHKRPPKSSGVLHEAIEKARSQIEKVPQKRSLVDTLVEMNEKNQQRWDDEAKEKLLLQKRSQLLEEFKLGLWTKDEYRDQVQLLGGGGPVKRQKSASDHSERYSDDWDLGNFNSD
ncbi:hypothetical protein BJ912DRAFT_852063 [Pholiota molesta]|nr:hypothetical protein BJ912DRAFT_852063 [Pholiota molesta]